MKVLATYSIKGGVGKTTAAVNLGYEASRAGARVLLWDLDPQGAATFFVRVKPSLKGGAERLVSKRGDLTDRRHWHTGCWRARHRRGPGVLRSRGAPRYG